MDFLISLEVLRVCSPVEFPFSFRHPRCSCQARTFRVGDEQSRLIGGQWTNRREKKREKEEKNLSGTAQGAARAAMSSSLRERDGERAGRKGPYPQGFAAGQGHER